MKRSEKKENKKRRLKQLAKNRPTLKTYIWLSFIVFTFLILALLWVFQYVMLEAYYSSMKANDLETSAQIISDAYASQNDEQLLEIVRQQAFKNNVCIVITDNYGNDEHIENMLGSFSFFETDINNNYNRFLYSLISELDSRNKSTIMKKYQSEKFKSQELFYVSKISADDKTGYLFIEAALEPIDSTTIIIKRQLIYITIILFELAFIITLFISKRLSQPIVNLNKTAKKFAQGDYKTEFREDEGYEEVRELAGTLNNARIEVSKVTDLRRDLIANVSHDLRTPLTLIKSYAEMIRDLSGDNPEKRNAHIQVIIDESDRLTALVNSLLEISKIESGNIKLEISEFSIHEKMDNIMQRYRVLVERDGYDITFVPDDDVICRGDSAKIDQVIYNLINNAVNYCGEGKKIVIRQINKPGAVRIEVTDDGQGIAKDKLPKIFDRYYRDERNKRDKIGTGLGLSIVQGILKKHQFPFGVVSEEGKGSTFWFEFIVENEKDKQKEKPSKKQGKKPV